MNIENIKVVVNSIYNTIEIYENDKLLKFDEMEDVGKNYISDGYLDDWYEITTSCNEKVDINIYWEETIITAVAYPVIKKGNYTETSVETPQIIHNIKLIQEPIYPWLSN